MNEYQQNRQFMQCPVFGDHMSKSDQQQGIPHPPHGNALRGEAIVLPPFENAVTRPAYTDLLDTRRSERVYTDQPMTQQQLAFLLWSAQGIQEFRGANKVATLRPVPSGGARHPFELYFAVRNVEGLEPGLYHYTPVENAGEKRVTIERIGAFEDYPAEVTGLVAGQSWAAKASIVLLISCVPYRAEWRYGGAAHRVMLIDLGHIGQNVMLSAAALGLGSCCIAAFDQAVCDKALGLDGIEEYTVYVIPIGSIAQK